jgi:hypothetical protein
VHHSGEASEVIRAACAIALLSEEPTGHGGVLPPLLRCLASHRRDVSVVISVCRALRNLARLDSNCEELAVAGGVELIYDATLLSHPSDAACCEWACRVLWNVVAEPAGSRAIFSCENLASSLAQATRTHSCSFDVVFAVLGFLRSLVTCESSQKGAMRDFCFVAGDVLSDALCAAEKSPETDKWCVLQRTCELLKLFAGSPSGKHGARTGDDVGAAAAASGTGVFESFLRARGAERLIQAFAAIKWNPSEDASDAAACTEAVCRAVSSLAYATPLVFAAAAASCVPAVIAALESLLQLQPPPANLNTATEACCGALESLSALPEAAVPGLHAAVASKGGVQALVSVLTLACLNRESGLGLSVTASTACRALANLALAKDATCVRELREAGVEAALRSVLSSSVGSLAKSHARAALVCLQRELGASTLSG